MTNIADFPFRNTVLVDFGTVTVCSDPSKIGRELFLVSWADADGAEIILYDSADYTMASHEAKEAKRDFGAVSIIERFRHKGGQANG